MKNKKDLNKQYVLQNTKKNKKCQTTNKERYIK